MTSHDEWMLECGLHEVLGGKAAPDLSGRILAALGGPDGSRPDRSRRPALWPRSHVRSGVAGFAASVLLVLGIWVLAGPGKGRTVPSWRIAGAVAPDGRWISTSDSMAIERVPGVHARLFSGKARAVSDRRIELSEGHLAVSKVPGSPPLEVATPAGTVSVKGTAFVVWVRREGPFARKETSMNRSFWWGTGAGVATSVAVVAGSVLFTEGEVSRTVEAGSVASAQPGQPPSVPEDLSEKLSALAAELERSRTAEAEARKQLKQTQAKADLFGSILDKLGAQNAEMQEHIDSQIKVDAINREIAERGKLRHRIMAGKPLPEGVARYLGLTDSEKEQLSADLIQEERLVKQLVVDLVREKDPSFQIATGDPEFDMKLQMRFGSLMQQDGTFEKLIDLDGKSMKEGEQVYLEDLLGGDAVLTRLSDGWSKIRKKTLDNAAGVLAPEKHAKAVELMSNCFNSESGGIMLPPFVQARRPK